MVGATRPDQAVPAVDLPGSLRRPMKQSYVFERLIVACPTPQCNGYGRVGRGSPGEPLGVRFCPFFQNEPCLALISNRSLRRSPR